MEDEQNKGGDEIGQDVETHSKRSMVGERTNDQTRDDMWMSALFTKTRAKSPWAMQVHVRKRVCEKIRV